MMSKQLDSGLKAAGYVIAHRRGSWTAYELRTVKNVYLFLSDNGSLRYGTSKSTSIFVSKELKEKILKQGTIFA